MVGYIAPALTPTSGNPTFRVYSVDPVTFAVLDFSVYYANITSPTFQDGPKWQVTLFSSQHILLITDIWCLSTSFVLIKVALDYQSRPG